MTKHPQKKARARKPRIIRLDTDGKPGAQKPSDKPRRPRAQSDMSKISTRVDIDADDVVLEKETNDPASRGFNWTGLFVGTLGALVSLGMGLALDGLIRELFARQSWLGWVASGLTLVLVIAGLALVVREIWGISRLNTIANLRSQALQVQSGEQPANGLRVVDATFVLYAGRADTLTLRTKFNKQRADIMDGQDLLMLFETTFMGPLDERAKTLVMQSAKRVSIVTAISPRAIVDIAYVLLENTRLIRRISQLYGGRPGAFGFWKLTRNILGHLAVTGAIAAGDSLIQQFVGHGVAARVSSKLGEGVVNGLLTARIGIAAMDQSRPMAFDALKRPGVSQYFTELTRFSSTNDDG